MSIAGFDNLPLHEKFWNIQSEELATAFISETTFQEWYDFSCNIHDNKKFISFLLTAQNFHLLFPQYIAELGY